MDAHLLRHTNDDPAGTSRPRSAAAVSTSSSLNAYSRNTITSQGSMYSSPGGGGGGRRTPSAASHRLLLLIDDGDDSGRGADGRLSDGALEVGHSPRGGATAPAPRGAVQHVDLPIAAISQHANVSETTLRDALQFPCIVVRPSAAVEERILAAEAGRLDVELLNAADDGGEGADDRLPLNTADLRRLSPNRRGSNLSASADDATELTVSLPSSSSHFRAEGAAAMEIQPAQDAAALVVLQHAAAAPGPRRVGFRPTVDVIVYRVADELIMSVQRSSDQRTGWIAFGAALIFSMIFSTAAEIVALGREISTCSSSAQNSTTQYPVVMAPPPLLFVFSVSHGCALAVSIVVSVVAALAACSERPAVPANGGAGATTRSFHGAAYDEEDVVSTTSVRLTRAATVCAVLLPVSFLGAIGSVLPVSAAAFARDPSQVQFTPSHEHVIPWCLLDTLPLLFCAHRGIGQPGGIKKAPLPIEWAGGVARAVAWLAALLAGDSDWSLEARWRITQAAVLYVASAAAFAGYFLLWPRVHRLNVHVLAVISCDCALRCSLGGGLHALWMWAASPAGGTTFELYSSHCLGAIVVEGALLGVAVFAMLFALLISLQYVDERNVFALSSFVWALVPFLLRIYDNMVQTPFATTPLPEAFGVVASVLALASAGMFLAANRLRGPSYVRLGALNVYNYARATPNPIGSRPEVAAAISQVETAAEPISTGRSAAAVPTARLVIRALPEDAPM